MTTKYIRWANTEDAESLVKLNDSFNGIGISTEQVSQSLMNSNELVALALLDGKPVGFACAQVYKSFCYKDLQGEITELFIEEEARRQGLATELIEFLVNRFKEMEITNIKVITGSSINALKTYGKTSFTKKNHVVLYRNLKN